MSACKGVCISICKDGRARRGNIYIRRYRGEGELEGYPRRGLTGNTSGENRVARELLYAMFEPRHARDRCDVVGIEVVLLRRVVVDVGIMGARVDI